MAELHDKLAVRIAAVLNEAMPDVYLRTQVDGNPRLASPLSRSIRVVVDEMIRQMRWSRHSYRWANPEDMLWDNGYDRTEEPTMAPDNWPPDEIEILPTTTHTVPFPPGMVEIRGVRIQDIHRILPPTWGLR